MTKVRMSHEVHLTASDESPHRIERLNRVLGYFYSRCPQSYEDLHQLEDHRGTLTVTWNQKPSPFAKGIAKQAWESPIGDGGGPIVHVVAADQF